MPKFFEEASRAHLIEELVPASMKELQAAMDTNDSLKCLLTTKAKDLPREYQFLVRELTDEYEEKTLLDVIDLCLFYSRPRNFWVTSFFSKAGDKIVGFVAYAHTRKVVEEIKIFTLEPGRPNPVLFRDLKALLKELVEQYDSVSWAALIKNPANRAYERAIKEFGGTKKVLGDTVYYTVPR